MLDLTSQMVKEGIKRLRELGMREWLYFVRPKDSLKQHDAQEDAYSILFTETIRHVLMRRTIRISMVALQAPADDRTGC